MKNLLMLRLSYFIEEGINFNDKRHICAVHPTFNSDQILGIEKIRGKKLNFLLENWALATKNSNRKVFKSQWFTYFTLLKIKDSRITRDNKYPFWEKTVRCEKVPKGADQNFTLRRIKSWTCHCRIFVIY